MVCGIWKDALAGFAGAVTRKCKVPSKRGVPSRNLGSKRSGWPAVPAPLRHQSDDYLPLKKRNNHYDSALGRDDYGDIHRITVAPVAR